MITGIQQVGIGVPEAIKAKFFYRDHFGFDTKVFDDKADATLMTKYTGDEIHHRHAILAMNLSGGGGIEIWQYLSRKPATPVDAIQPGDPGIFATKIKTRNIKAAHDYFSSIDSLHLSPVYFTPENKNHFWVKDCFGNWFTIIESKEWFKKSKKHCGGVAGAIIGVSDMKKALPFYKEVLGINREIYNVTAPFPDLPDEFDNQKIYHRVLLKKEANTKGAFSKLLGDIEVELVQSMDESGTHIFNDRYWGDCGFIHLCFDVIDMDGLLQKAEAAGFSFTVDSKGSFSMEQAAGRFCYMEDPDGTLIELVETHKVPAIKKIGWYIDLKKRKQNLPLPSWMINCMGLSKIK